MGNTGQSITLAKKNAYLAGLRRGLRKREAATNIGMGYDTILAYRKNHPEFMEEISEAEMAACEPIEAVLYDMCIKDKHFSSIIFWLMNRGGGYWKDHRSPTTIVQQRIDKDLTEKDLKIEIEKMLKNLKPNSGRVAAEPSSMPSAASPKEPNC